MRIANRPLVAFPGTYALCLSKKEYEQTLKQLNVVADPKTAWLIDGAAATTHYFVPESGGMARVCIVCLGDRAGKSVEQVNAILTHEAVHIWQEIRDMIGEDKPSREFEAYAIQGIAQELMELMNQELQP